MYRDAMTATSATTRRTFLGGFALGIAALRLHWHGFNTAAAASGPKRLVEKSVLEAGAAWVRAQQDASGGFPDPRGSVDLGVTAETVSCLIALRNVGVEVEIDKAVAYLQKHAGDDREQSAGGDGKVIVALVGAGADPRDVGGVDLVARVVKSWDKTSGTYGTEVFDPAFALMALHVAGEQYEPAAVTTLQKAQLDDGSWAFDLGATPGSGDATMTSFVVQLLVALDAADDAMVAKSVTFLRALQVEDGAFSYSPGAPADANTGGFVISALNAVGEKPKSAAWHHAAAALAAFQSPDGGFVYMHGDPQNDFLSTIPALIALAGGSYPVLTVA